MNGVKAAWCGVVMLLLVAQMGCCGLGSAPPKLEWDPSPQALLMEATYEKGGESGSVHDSIKSNPNYIPEARVWGDGRILWVERQGGQRRVLEGRLSREELAALLQQFATAGFFTWKGLYAVPLPFSGSPRDDTLTVALRSARKEVRVTTGAPPERFDALLRTVTSGAGATGRAFTPTQGYLKAIAFPAGPQPYPWPQERFGFALAEVGAGRMIEGEALETVWQLINEDFVRPRGVASAGVTYRVELLIPGVTRQAPPSP